MITCRVAVLITVVVAGLVTIVIAGLVARLFTCAFPAVILSNRLFFSLEDILAKQCEGFLKLLSFFLDSFVIDFFFTVKSLV
nr:hypothetical protein [Candidatus Sigynarchaeota archaeon]